MKNSITHHHLCAVINTELKKKQNKPERFRILDMGCGSGKLVEFLQKTLPNIHQDIKFEVYGFDVVDSKVQHLSFFTNTLTFLKDSLPEINWEERIFQISSAQEWPFSADYFDCVVSNQVMEHILDHNFSFRQINRVLLNDGFSIHLFPLCNYIYEGHLFIPFVHWICNEDLLFWYIKFSSIIGIGNYKQYLKMGYCSDVTDYARKHTDFIIYETNYLSEKDIHLLAKHNKLKSSFRYTEDFYFHKLKEMFNASYDYNYSTNKNILMEKILFVFLVRLSSITLTLRKSNSYVNIHDQ